MLRFTVSSLVSATRAASVRLLSTSVVVGAPRKARGTADAQAQSTPPESPDTHEMESIFEGEDASARDYDFNAGAPGQDQQQQYGRDSSERKRFRGSIGVNRVELLGGVAMDPYFSTTRNGEEWATFRLITNTPVYRRDGGVDETTEVHSVNCFANLIKYVRRNVKKGSRVMVHGKLHYHIPDPNDRTNRRASIRADLVQVIAKSNYEDNADNGGDDEQQHAEMQGL